jgi:hypothetical protein
MQRATIWWRENVWHEDEGVEFQAAAIPALFSCDPSSPHQFVDFHPFP